MFAGHIGAALAIGRVERRVSVGAFVLAALLLDVVLWLFVLVGWETVSIPGDFAATHQAEFVFPYSHGLLAAIGWSLLAGAAAFLWYPERGVGSLRATVFVGMAVLSHWLLDALVHVPELPLAGENSTKVGLGLWQTMPVTLVLEALIVLAGLWFFVAGADLSRGRMVALSGLALGTLAFTVAGMTVAPPPPSVTAMASSSLATIVILCALVGWLAKRATG